MNSPICEAKNTCDQVGCLEKFSVRIAYCSPAGSKNLKWNKWKLQQTTPTAAVIHHFVIWIRYVSEIKCQFLSSRYVLCYVQAEGTFRDGIHMNRWIDEWKSGNRWISLLTTSGEKRKIKRLIVYIFQKTLKSTSCLSVHSIFLHGSSSTYQFGHSKTEPKRLLNRWKEKAKKN